MSSFPDDLYPMPRSWAERAYPQLIHYKQPPKGHILHNLTLYWLTGTGASAAWWYWEFGQFLAAAGGAAPPPVKVPVAFTTFPGEVFAAPRSWIQTSYPVLAYFNEVDRGGHFAAWEEPALFASEMLVTFKPLR